MRKTIYKILGKRGRITIPWEIRKELGFSHNDVVSFEVDGCSVIVNEKSCAPTAMAVIPIQKTTPLY